jgi:hypothetical protein
MTIRCMTIRYTGILASFDDPATAAVVLAPEIAARAEKDRKRQEQRHPGSTPGRGRGRPRLTEAEAVDSRERRRAYMREHMREKRALARFWVPVSKQHGQKAGHQQGRARDSLEGFRAPNIHPGRANVPMTTARLGDYVSPPPC